MTIDKGGNVGIGTTTPQHALHVTGTGTRTIFGENTTVGGVGVSGEATKDGGRGVCGVASATKGETQGGGFRSDGDSGTGVYGEATAASGFTNGVWGVSASADGKGVSGWATAASGVNNGVSGTSDSVEGIGVFGWATTGSGNTYGVYGRASSEDGLGVYSLGDFAVTGAKNFIQPHPSDPSKEIHFVSLEGNESGTYFRGSAKLASGRAVIEVPEEFRLVTETEGLTVQLTAKGPDAGLWVESESLDRIVVRGHGDVGFNYFINGVRRGFADLKLIRQNRAYVPDVRGIPFGTQYREGHRRILVENGILNADFTPNEQTARETGWSLRNPTTEELSRYEVARAADGAKKR